jgi:hypothetical protein
MITVFVDGLLESTKATREHKKQFMVVSLCGEIASQLY